MPHRCCIIWLRMIPSIICSASSPRVEIWSPLDFRIRPGKTTGKALGKTIFCCLHQLSGGEEIFRELFQEFFQDFFHGSHYIPAFQDLEVLLTAISSFHKLHVRIPILCNRNTQRLLFIFAAEMKHLKEICKTVIVVVVFVARLRGQGNAQRFISEDMDQRLLPESYHGFPYASAKYFDVVRIRIRACHLVLWQNLR
ncbi:hypothetical protein FVE85_4205 [Porphyridium purpureum]|uniref:Uncharacterized protein n=1 Tax=Porphyridium purpureum TaxID=35688 RepID=A0A5J4YTH2_PORPP|nr:hypothetical protein FVE85_4205 [Porphyridium purpureum]|eukprot:POR5864..scf229_5